MARSSLIVLLALAGCAFGVDGGVLTHPAFVPAGGSVGGHIGIGGGGASTSDFLLAIDLDTRVDVASGGSRWTAGASALGGVKLHDGLFAIGRVGVWRAIVSGSNEASAVPSFELGAFMPLRERFDPKFPQHGSSAEGLIAGLREDVDDASYLTVFVGYAMFLALGY